MIKKKTKTVIIINTNKINEQDRQDIQMIIILNMYGVKLLHFHKNFPK